jgi:protein-S-isoprenylcysteine O-methyltransferase Ste14
MRARKRGKILLVASLLAYQGVENFAVYSAAKAYVLRLGEALHRELKRDGITVTALCPGMSDTGFAKAAQQKITTTLKLLMMKPAPVVRAGIRALQAGRISVVPGWSNKASVIFMWVTPRWLHQAVFSRVMNATPDRARIIAPPPLLALGCILLGFVARHFFPLRWFAPANTLPILVGVVMIAISIAVVVLARRTFIAQGTHSNPYRPTKALVMTGVFSVSRNPIYVAFLLFVLAFALLANSLWFVISASVLLLVLHFGVVKQEERYLREKFGDSYEQYCSRVRRWI